MRMQISLQRAEIAERALGLNELQVHQVLVASSMKTSRVQEGPRSSNQ
jgi:hypothetical protein